MRIEHFSADGFRNLENIDIDLHPELNVICGQNAQGKTNMMPKARPIKSPDRCLDHISFDIKTNIVLMFC